LHGFENLKGKRAMLVIDTNTSCAGRMSELKSRGVTTVGRYYGVQASYRDIIGKAEAQELSRNGISIFVVFEKAGNASDLTLSTVAGIADANTALGQAAAIGQPRNSAIYFAAEGLPDGYTSQDLPNLRLYFKGIKQTLAGHYAVGVYGDGVVCQTMFTEGFCQFTWLAAASSSFERTCKYFGGEVPDWDLAQVPPLDMDWNGLSTDFDVPNLRRNNGNFGAFVVPYPAV
jgi:hypothetical protein